MSSSPSPRFDATPDPDRRRPACSTAGANGRAVATDPERDPRHGWMPPSVVDPKAAATGLASTGLAGTGRRDIAPRTERRRSAPS